MIPVMAKLDRYPDELTVTLTLTKRPPNRLGGFKVGWMEGQDDRLEFDVCCGAGCGNSLFELRIEPKHDGAEPVYYEVSMKGPVEELVNQFIKEAMS